MPENNLAELVRLAKKKDNAAIAALYEQTHRRVYLIALMTVKNEQDALDVMQDTYVTALRKLHTLKDPLTFESWLHQVARNKCRDFFKKHRELLVNGENEALFENVEDDNTEFLPPEALEKAEVRETVLNAVKSLPPTLSQTVMCYYLDEMTVTQIGLAMQCPAGTVSKRLASARDRIKKSLANNKEKLFSMAPLPILTQLLHQAGSGGSGWSPAAEASDHILKKIITEVHMSLFAIIASSLKGLLATVGGKAAAVGVAAAIVAGGATTAVVMSNTAGAPGVSDPAVAWVITTTAGNGSATPTQAGTGNWTTTLAPNTTQAPAFEISTTQPVITTTQPVITTTHPVITTTQPTKAAQPTQPISVPAVYTPIKVTPSSKGDVDGDGWLTSNDALIIHNIAVGKYPATQEQMVIADMNSDGRVGAVDMVILCQMIGYDYNLIPVN